MTEHFWDNVSSHYSNHSLTSHHADFEMSQVTKTVANSKLNGIASFGVANSSRDPFQVLKSLNYTPNEIIVSDISKCMLDESRKTLHEYPNVSYVHGGLQTLNKIDSIISKKNSIFMLGVYNVNYLKQSLDLYIDNKDTIPELTHI